MESLENQPQVFHPFHRPWKSLRDSHIPKGPTVYALKLQPTNRATVYGKMVCEMDVDALIRSAIEHRRLLELIYGNKRRIVEPHDYGIHRGVIKLLAFQIAGDSSGPLPNWRWLDVQSISAIHLLDTTFGGGRPNPSGKHHHWDQLFLRVKPPED